MQSLIALLPFLLLSVPALGSHHAGKRSNSSRHRSLADDMTKRASSQAPAGGFQTVGDSGVSAQMMFVGTTNTVYILDSEYSSVLLDSGANDRNRKQRHDSHRTRWNHSRRLGHIIRRQHQHCYPHVGHFQHLLRWWIHTR